MPDSGRKNYPAKPEGTGHGYVDSRSAAPMPIGVESRPFGDENRMDELKLDGERPLACPDRSGIRLVNRHFVRLLARFPERATLNDSVFCRCILDGERVIVDGNGCPDFGEVERRTRIHRKIAIERAAELRPAVFVTFDVLDDTDRDIPRLPLMERKAIVDDLVEDTARMSVSRYMGEKGTAFYDLAKNAVWKALSPSTGTVFTFPAKERQTG